MTGFMRLVIWDVDHGACAMLQHIQPMGLAGNVGGRLAMIDSGRADEFSPSGIIRHHIGRTWLDYLFITNADQDHMSDLKGLQDAGIRVNVLHRNPTYTALDYRCIKLGGGALTHDATWYANACETFHQPAQQPFNQHMGGITATAFCNQFPAFTDTNNLSLAVFFSFGGFSILFPGDLEKPGWRALLQQPAFVRRLAGLDMLVASHHGRESGFCSELFQVIRPQAIVISDKPVEHETQVGMVPDYRRVTQDAGVIVATTMKRRHVLTTRRDGWIQVDVQADGRFTITTEHHG